MQLLSYHGQGLGIVLVFNLLNRESNDSSRYTTGCFSASEKRNRKSPSILEVAEMFEGDIKSRAEVRFRYI